MENYTKVQKAKEETLENEIKVAARGQVRKYLSYALRILKHSDKHNSITIKASGNSIAKAMQIVELIKRKVGNLHQINKIKTMTIEEKYEPKIEGLNPIQQTRNISAYDCILSKDQLDQTDPGYQAPKPAEEPTSHEHTRKRVNNANTNKDRKDQPQSRKPKAEPSETGKPVEKSSNEHKKGKYGNGRRYNDDSKVVKPNQELVKGEDILDRVTPPPGEPNNSQKQAKPYRHEHLENRERVRDEPYHREQNQGFRGDRLRGRRGVFRGQNGQHRDDYHLQNPKHHHEDDNEFDITVPKQQPPIRREQGGYVRSFAYENRGKPQYYNNQQRFYPEDQIEPERRRGGFTRARASHQSYEESDRYYYQKQPQYYENYNRGPQHYYDEPPHRGRPIESMRGQPYTRPHPEQYERHYEPNVEFPEKRNNNGDPYRQRESTIRIRAGRGEVRVRGVNRGTYNHNQETRNEFGSERRSYDKPKFQEYEQRQPSQTTQPGRDSRGSRGNRGGNQERFN